MIVGPDESASRSKGDSAVLDQDTSECLHYESITGYPPKSIAEIPRGILEDHANIEIRNDLIDCSIDVCALEASQLVVLVFHSLF
jgi:translation initiation factor eIF-2B subunit epsilon